MLLLDFIIRNELAFSKICLVLPEIISEVVNKTKLNPRDSTVFQGLAKRYNADICNILLKIAFEGYNGIDFN